MASGFRRARDGGLTARLSTTEAALLARVMADLLALLGPPAPPGDPLEALVGLDDTETATPADPVLARLLPDAYRDDPDAAAEFRRFTETSLREQKRAAAQAVLDDLQAAPGAVTLPAERGELWLAALNDVRLALGTRLEITEEAYDELAERARHDPAVALYDWLTWLQETLVRALADW